MKKLLAILTILAYLGQAPFQGPIMEWMYNWEIDQWNKGGLWRKWCEFRNGDEE